MRSILFLLVAVTLSCSPAKKNNFSQNKQFSDLYTKYWDYVLIQNPVSATMYGVHDYNDQLGNPSVAQNKKDLTYYKGLLVETRKLPFNKLNALEKANRDYFVNVLKNNIKSLELENYYIVWDSRGGFHTYLAELPNLTPFKTKKDYLDYLERLNKFPNYFQDFMDLAKEGLSKGFTYSKKPMEGYEKTFSSLISKDPKESLFYKPFKNLPKSISKSDQKLLKSAAIKAIQDSVNPSYKKLLTFWNKKVVPRMIKRPSTYALPNGRKRYQYFINYHTSMNLKPIKIHQTGMSEVTRIRTEMKKILKKLKYTGNIRSFSQGLRKNPKLFPKTKKELLTKIKNKLKAMDKKLPELFGKLPKTPYGIKEIPSYKAPKGTTAYYWPPALDGSRKGYYYVNTYALNQRPLYEIEALSFHEAVPGHHLQIALQQEIENLPKFRHIERSTVFVEGWALYAESIAKEVGFYQDPYSDFGRLTYEMWRACRLVVDTGIHALGWSRSMAIQFMKNNTALTQKNIEVEVDRYITWPAQSLAYKMGELKIKELRKRAEEKLGKNFDIKEFHDRILANGAIPINTLENHINDWIKTKK